MSLEEESNQMQCSQDRGHAPWPMGVRDEGYLEVTTNGSGTEKREE